MFLELPGGEAVPASQQVIDETLVEALQAIPEPKNVGEGSPSGQDTLPGLELPSPSHGPEVPTIPSPPPLPPKRCEIPVGQNGGGTGERKRGPDEELEFLTESVPPEPLSRSAIYGRMRRVFQKKKDGTMPLDDQWNNLWKDCNGGGRDQLMAMFEKVGFNTDRVTKNVVVR